MNKRDKIAEYAYRNSVFYRDYIAEGKYIDKEWEKITFDELPIVSKEDIVKSRLPLEPMEYFIGKKDEEIVEVSTSGSTGKVFKILWNQADVLKSMLYLWILRKRYYGIKTSDKMCYFYTIRRDGDKEIREAKVRNTLGFSKMDLSEERLINIYKTMAVYAPKWLILQPSIAGLLLYVAKKNELKRIESIEYIELSGELLTEDLRRQLKEFFQCRIANQYGSYEVNSIAYECPYGNMHIVSGNVYVEEEDGELIITSLTNKRNPFIRYRIGDRGKIIRKSCLCGNVNSTIEITDGRTYNYIKGNNGAWINAYIFVRAVENINQHLDDVIIQFQVIQKETDLFWVRMYIDDMSLENEIMRLFEMNIADEGLIGAKYEYSFEKQYLKDERSGKLMYFKRECE